MRAGDSLHVVARDHGCSICSSCVPRKTFEQFSDAPRTTPVGIKHAAHSPGHFVRYRPGGTPGNLSGDYLDVGSGEGELLKTDWGALLGARFACDYTTHLMKLPGQPVDIVDLNHDSLPYSDNRFALVTCAETIEHLEHYRETIREIHRVLRPGGLAIISTPNILNLRSRLHYLMFGFRLSFGPLLVGEQEVHSPPWAHQSGWLVLSCARAFGRWLCRSQTQR